MRTDDLIARLDSIEAGLHTIKEFLVAKIRQEDGEPGAGAPSSEEVASRSRLPLDPPFVAHRLRLTPRESEVSVMLVEGRSVQEIAAALGCKVSTVRTFLKNTKRKLGVSRQSQLVRAVLLAVYGQDEER